MAGYDEFYVHTNNIKSNCKIKSRIWPEELFDKIETYGVFKSFV